MWTYNIYIIIKEKKQKHDGSATNDILRPKKGTPLIGDHGSEHGHCSCTRERHGKYCDFFFFFYNL